MRKQLILPLVFLTSLTFILFACGDEEAIEPADNNNNTETQELSKAFDQFIDAVEVYIDGNQVVIKSNGIPNHKSPYFNESNSMYITYNGSNTNFRLNPNRIQEQSLTFRIPLNPTEANNKSATPMGPIGVSVNGIPFFNQYAAGRSALDQEIDSFDQYNGHPQMTGQYHYHIEPLYLTETLGREALLGFLLDGFPVYGPEEDGQLVSNADLDAYHGHDHVTDEYPDGIYHYHISLESPYLNGDGFFGTAGTVSR